MIQLWSFRSLFLLCPMRPLRSDFTKFDKGGGGGGQNVFFPYKRPYLKRKYSYLYGTCSLFIVTNIILPVGGAVVKFSKAKDNSYTFYLKFRIFLFSGGWVDLEGSIRAKI